MGSNFNVENWPPICPRWKLTPLASFFNGYVNFQRSQGVIFQQILSWKMTGLGIEQIIFNVETVSLILTSRKQHIFNVVSTSKHNFETTSDFNVETNFKRWNNVIFQNWNVIFQRWNNLRFQRWNNLIFQHWNVIFQRWNNARLKRRINVIFSTFKTTTYLNVDTSSDFNVDSF